MRLESTKGEKNRLSKLTWEIVNDIRTSGLSNAELCEKYQITDGHVRKIKRQAVWKPYVNKGQK